jgi:hypothetical protein
MQDKIGEETIIRAKLAVQLYTWLKKSLYYSSLLREKTNSSQTQKE